MLQAEILAKYKPTINATLLVPQLEQVEQTTAKAIEYLRTTRHVVLYYEDLITNPNVRTCHFFNLEIFRLEISSISTKENMKILKF